jgi:hypothetical protein
MSICTFISGTILCGRRPFAAFFQGIFIILLSICQRTKGWERSHPKVNHTYRVDSSGVHLHRVDTLGINIYENPEKVDQPGYSPIY